MQKSLTTQDVILRMPDILKITGLSISTIWRFEKKGIFPKRRKIGLRAIGWKQSEIDEWLTTRTSQEGLRHEN